MAWVGRTIAPGSGPLAFTLPWPPSSNNYRTVARGRLILSSEARRYFERCAARLLEQGIPKLELAGQPLRVGIVAYAPDRRRRDLDGLLKQALDSLVKYGLLADDRWISELRIWWGAELRAGGALTVALAAYGQGEARPELFPVQRPPRS